MVTRARSVLVMYTRSHVVTRSDIVRQGELRQWNFVNVHLPLSRLRGGEIIGKTL